MRDLDGDIIHTISVKVVKAIKNPFNANENLLNVGEEGTLEKGGGVIFCDNDGHVDLRTSPEEFLTKYQDNFVFTGEVTTAAAGQQEQY